MKNLKHFLFSVGTAISFFAFLGQVSAEENNPKAPLHAQGVNVQINSEELEPFSVDKKTDPEEKLVFYSDQNTSVDINDSGEPNLNMRF